MHGHTLAGVIEVCCSGVKQKFKYLLSNKRITPSVAWPLTEQDELKREG